MGYYTQYNLEAIGQYDEDSVNRFIQEVSGYPIEIGKYTDTIKWYNALEDVKKLSEKFPDVLFTLWGEGEESGDLWKAVYKDGKTKYVKAVITFPAIGLDDLE